MRHNLDDIREEYYNPFRFEEEIEEYEKEKIFEWVVETARWGENDNQGANRKTSDETC